MAYTNSPLVSFTKLSPNNSGARVYPITRITPHCVVGQCSAETIGNIFVDPSYQASSNYGIGYDGRVGMYVEEKNRSWCSSSYDNDNRAVTIECASDSYEPYAFRDVVYQKLITLCVDICKRNGKKKLLWFGDKAKTLSYSPKPDEMVLSVHQWFANKSCPGDWMYSRMSDLANKVTAQLNGEEIKPVPQPETNEEGTVNMDIRKCYLTKNDCYVRNSREIKLPSNQQDYRYRNYYKGPKKIVVHSTGANNPWLCRYVQPNDGILGENRYNNSWNRPGLDVCVHAFIGKTENGDLAVYQTLPWEYRCWGVGSGRYGSYNDQAIQFEICEDALTDANYCKKAYELAAHLCAYLLKLFPSIDEIVSHDEAGKRGFGSNHGDPANWWSKFGLTMDTFRARVNEIISEKENDEMRYNTIRDLKKDENAAKYYLPTIQKLVEKGIILGKGGSGDGLIIDLSEDSVRLLVYLDRANVFGN